MVKITGFPMKEEKITEGGIDYIVITDQNKTVWHAQGQLHRINGPAVLYRNGGQEWWYQGLRHRKGGPAIQDVNGTQFWYYDGKPHREDGPAIIFTDGYQEWYYQGKYIEVKSQKEYEQWLKLKTFI